MKKFFLLSTGVLALASCTTITKTASDVDVPSSLYSATVADLEVSPERVTYTMTPSKEIQRGGLANVKRAVESEALTKNGNADILVEPEYIISQKKGLFSKKITSITVTGRPAKYANFHSLSDSVWCNDVFRAGYKNSVKDGKGGILKGMFGK
ncbi:MAG: hypothetical protein K2F69_05195 [Bacteroidaceae bacterium]|nr:hypothetical protein [Bacteroidaceae bacterium]